MAVNQLNWTLWQGRSDHYDDRISLHTPYTNTMKAAHYVINLRNSTQGFIFHQACILYKQNTFYLRVSGNYASIYTHDYKNGATLILDPWPKNTKNFASSIILTFKLLLINEVHNL